MLNADHYDPAIYCLYYFKCSRRCAFHSEIEYNGRRNVNRIRCQYRTCVRNSCSRKWLRPMRRVVTILIALRLWQLQKLFEDSLMICKIFFLKTWKLFSLRILGSNLSHPITIDGKNAFLKNLCFILDKVILSTL